MTVALVVIIMLGLQHLPVETEYKFDHPFIEDPNPEMENWLILEVDLTIPEYQGMIEAGIILKTTEVGIALNVNQAEIDLLVLSHKK